MSALLPSDEAVLAACAAYDEASPSTDPSAHRGSMRAALIAAWNRRTAPVGAWSREDGPHPAYALAAKVCRERAKYYDDTKGHVDRDQIARSYRATADEIERLDLTPEGLSVVIHDALPSQEDVARVIDPGAWATHQTNAAVKGHRTRARYVALGKAAAILSLLGQTGDGWLPIESAPKDGTWFLVIDPNSDMAWAPYGFCAWMKNYSGREYWCEEDVSEEIFPTHWRPLPAPPAKEGR